MENIIKAGSYRLEYKKRTLIMGILNITPDSFSDGGRYNHVDRAVARAIEMVEEGADIIDIGGESTRPGANKVSEEEELERVIGIIEAVSRTVECPISIDTYKAEVAKAAIKAGAVIINDISGAKAQPEIATVASQYNVPIILTHNRDSKEYQNLIADVVGDLKQSINICYEAGVSDEQIILDPGIGFAKTYEQNLDVMRNLEEIVAIGYPVLLGTSRKSMIGLTLDLPAEERLEGSLATVCYGLMKGCQLVRVHDVKETYRAVKMIDVLAKKEGYACG